MQWQNVREILFMPETAELTGVELVSGNVTLTTPVASSS
jgi:hypothetical protein